PTIDFRKAADKIHWALSDHQGSVRDVIDNSGTVLNHWTLDKKGAGSPIKETEMMYYRARYFDPAVGIVSVRTRWGLGQRTDSSIAVSSGLQGAAILLALITSALR
ncbi:MAG: hypothetical protein O3A14_20690, partial [Cyanobacteria bacterium]|nr:hypothetical protein [Cyanobacteriota bacterium]